MNETLENGRPLGIAEMSACDEQHPSAPGGALGPGSTRVLLLVIDDDVRSARRLARMLDEDGYDAEVLGNGTEALARLAQPPPPDAIVTDLVMPGASGIAVLGEARRRWPGIPVLFVTGHPELLTQYPIPFEPSPIVFTKPLHYADFAARLREVIVRAH